MDHLRMCLEKCRGSRLSLNLAKCVFEVTSGALLGHVVSKEGIVVDSDKVKTILQAPTPSNTKVLSRFLGQIRWHSRMLRYLIDFATPFHAVVHLVPFQCSYTYIHTSKYFLKEKWDCTFVQMFYLFDYEQNDMQKECYNP